MPAPHPYRRPTLAFSLPLQRQGKHPRLGKYPAEHRRAERRGGHREKVVRCLERDVFFYIATRPVAELTPPNVLAVVHRIGARRVLETVHRALQNIGQLCRCAIATSRTPLSTPPRRYVKRCRSSSRVTLPPRPNRSAEAKVREILGAVVKPEKRICMGEALAAISRRIGFRQRDFAVFRRMRDKTQAEPLRFDRMIILDTNVVSKAMKPEPDAPVRACLNEQKA